MGSMSLKTNVLLLINVIIIIILLIIEGFHITENKCTFADPQPQLLEMINLYLFPPQKRLIGVDFRFLSWLGFGTKFTRLLHGDGSRCTSSPIDSDAITFTYCKKNSMILMILFDC